MSNSMINFVNIDAEIEKSLIIGLRTVFSFDPDFPYNESPSASRISISSAYPRKDDPMGIVHIVVISEGYQTSQQSLYNNFSDDIIEEGRVVGKKYRAAIPYSATLVCLAEGDAIAKDLANRVVSYLSFAAADLFNDILKLNIQACARTRGGPQRQIPEKAFAHTVSINGVLNWTGVMKNAAADIRPVAGIVGSEGGLIEIRGTEKTNTP
jgi:hypothetical protein